MDFARGGESCPTSAAGPNWEGERLGTGLVRQGLLTKSPIVQLSLKGSLVSRPMGTRAFHNFIVDHHLPCTCCAARLLWCPARCKKRLRRT